MFVRSVSFCYLCNLSGPLYAQRRLTYSQSLCPTSGVGRLGRMPHRACALVQRLHLKSVSPLSVLRTSLLPTRGGGNVSPLTKTDYVQSPVNHVSRSGVWIPLPERPVCQVRGPGHCAHHIHHAFCPRAVRRKQSCHRPQSRFFWLAGRLAGRSRVVGQRVGSLARVQPVFQERRAT